MNRPRPTIPARVIDEETTTHDVRPSRLVAACVALAGFVIAVGPALAQEPSADRPPAAATFAEYLVTWKIDRASRGVLEEGAEWTPAKQATALRIL
ncbi:MAG: hypothetical protein ACKOTB_19310, partial [Planctomycetia bacterium]